MDYKVNRKESFERYCPIIKSNVRMDVTQSGVSGQLSSEVCCHNFEECRACYGKCVNAYVCADVTAPQTTSCIQKRSG